MLIAAIVTLLAIPVVLIAAAFLTDMRPHGFGAED